MLLAIDVGNTHSVFGLFIDGDLKHYWRLPTNKNTTPDQVLLAVKGLLESENLSIGDVEGLVFCSVVPEISHCLIALAKKAKVRMLNVDDVKGSVVKIVYDKPETVGADRIANAVAVKELYSLPAIVVDFGTATTFDVISSQGDYLGGAIAPGLESALQGLLDKASQLYDIRLEEAKKAVGSNTKDSISSGFLLGLAGMTDYLIERIRGELKNKPVVIATGGFSKLMAPYCSKTEEVDPFLTLKGLELIYGREGNRDKWKEIKRLTK